MTKLISYQCILISKWIMLRGKISLKIRMSGKYQCEIISILYQLWMFTIILNSIDSTSSTSISTTTTTPSTIPPSDSCFKNCFDVSTRVFKNFIIKFSNGQLFSKMVKGGFMDFYPLNKFLSSLSVNWKITWNRPN